MKKSHWINAQRIEASGECFYKSGEARRLTDFSPERRDCRVVGRHTTRMGGLWRKEESSGFAPKVRSTKYIKSITISAICECSPYCNSLDFKRYRDIMARR